MINWHRVFGLTLTDFFTESPFVVELEKDLSFKRQLLDVVVVRKETEGFERRLPDGLENLAEHNLLSYKSLREPLDDWAMDELVGHYVNYRKQVSPSPDDLLSPERFRLYAVSTRSPRRLAKEAVLESLQRGVYEVQWGSRRIRVLALREMPAEEHNAIWLMLSGVRKRAISGAAQYGVRTSNTSTIIYQLFELYRLEGMDMPYTMEDFNRDFVREHRDQLLRYLSAEERLQGLSADERLHGISEEEIKEFLARQEKARKQRGH